VKTLAEIYETYKLPENGISDKGTSHSYIEEYERLFAPYRRRQPIRVLEIGLMRGGSLRMWHEYFGESQVYGIDISETPSDVLDLRKLMANLPERMSISILDSTNTAQVLSRIGDTHFDIIIEDASHDLNDSVMIYRNFFPLLNPGGIYIIEDVVDIEAAMPVLKVMTGTAQMQVLDLREKKKRWDDVMVVIK
jgi:predicted O-methyltransferase YrrM